MKQVWLVMIGQQEALDYRVEGVYATQKVAISTAESYNEKNNPFAMEAWVQSAPYHA